MFGGNDIGVFCAAAPFESRRAGKFGKSDARRAGGRPISPASSRKLKRPIGMYVRGPRNSPALPVAYLSMLQALRLSEKL